MQECDQLFCVRFCLLHPIYFEATLYICDKSTLHRIDRVYAFRIYILFNTSVLYFLTYQPICEKGLLFVKFPHETQIVPNLKNTTINTSFTV